MRTIDDLHEAITGIADQAATQIDLDALTTAPSEPRQRRRGQTWAIASVAATVAVVSFAVPTLLSGLHRDSRDIPAGSGFSAPLPLPGRGSALQFDFTVDTVPGEKLHYEGLRPNSQTAEFVAKPSCENMNQNSTITCRPYSGPVDKNTRLLTGAVTVFYQSAFDPTEAKLGEPVDVNGRPGYYAVIQAPDNDERSMTLVWEYAPGAWATVWDSPGGGVDDVKATELRHAMATHAATVAPLTPIRVQGLPEQLFTGYLAYYDDWTQGDFGLNDTSGEQWAVSWTPDPTPADVDHTSEVAINGRVWTVEHNNGAVVGIHVRIDGTDVAISHDGSAATLQDYIDIASQVEFAPNLHDSGTWFEASTSLPQ
jgi:hypothetical protein